MLLKVQNMQQFRVFSHEFPCFLIIRLRFSYNGSVQRTTALTEEEKTK